MKLQTKVLVIIATTWAILTAFLFIDFKLGIIRHYENLEAKLAEHEMIDTQRAYDKKVESLILFGYAFAQWDDAYNFMQKKSQKFISSNFVTGTFTNSKINFLMYFDSSGKYYDGASYTANTDKVSSVPQALVAYITNHPQFLQYNSLPEGNIGILNTPLGLIVMSAQPVLTSDGKGPARGSLLMGYYLTATDFEKLSDVVGMRLSFLPLAKVNADAKLRSIADTLQTRSYIISYVNHTIAHGYMLLNDIDNNPIGILQVDLPRYIYQEGLATSQHYIRIVLLLGLLVMSLTWILMEIFVIGRVMSISHQVAKLDYTSKSFQPILLSGKDELNNMVDTMNHMMSIITKSQSRLTYLANYDSLTQTPNRNHFHQLLNQAIVNAKRHDEKIAIMFLDMDKLKYVNDTFGHAVGDKLIQEAVTRIKGSIRSSDILARQSGDEFLLFLNNIPSLEFASNTAKRILHNTSQPFYLNDTIITVSFSIGISIYPDDGTTPDELIKNADQVMYKIKAQSGNDYEFYHS